MADPKTRSPAARSLSAGVEQGATDPKFLVIINSAALGQVVAFLPQQITEEVSANWDAPFKSTTGSTVNALASLVGRSTQFKYSTTQVWQGSEPFKMTLPIEFRAREDARNDVLIPVRTLQMMASPIDGGKGPLKPPGPYLTSVLSGSKTISDTTKQLTGRNLPTGDRISIQIGNILRLESVVIENVSVSWGVPINSEGVPMKAEVNMTFESVTVMTRSDFNRILSQSKGKVSG